MDKDKVNIKPVETKKDTGNTEPLRSTAADDKVNVQPVRTKKAKKPVKKKLIAFGVIGALALGGGYYALQSFGKSNTPQYTVYTVKPADALSLKGKVEPTQTQDFFYDQTKGTISEISVGNGAEVTAGTVVLKYLNSTAEGDVTQQQNAVNKSSLAAQQADEDVSAAQNQLNVANDRVWQTQQKIYAATDETQKAALNEQLTAQQAEVQTASDALRKAQQASQLAYNDLNAANTELAAEQGHVTEDMTANIDGIAVVDEKGKTSPETPVLRILSKTKQIEGVVTEYDLNKLAVGQTVEVTTVGSNQKAEGKIKSISTTAIPSQTENSQVASYNFIVEGEFPWADDLSTLISIKQDQLILPNSAIVKEKGKEYVYQYVAGKAKKVEIKTKEQDGRKVLESGLNKDAKIIENPDKAVKSGDVVQVAEDE